MAAIATRADAQRGRNLGGTGFARNGRLPIAAGLLRQLAHAPQHPGGSAQSSQHQSGQRIDHTGREALAQSLLQLHGGFSLLRGLTARLGQLLVLRRGARALLEDLLRRHVQGLPLRQGLGPLLGGGRLLGLRQIGAQAQRQGPRCVIGQPVLQRFHHQARWGLGRGGQRRLGRARRGLARRLGGHHAGLCLRGGAGRSSAPSGLGCGG